MARPDVFVPEVRRSLHRFRVASPWRSRTANRQLDLTGGVANRIDDRHIVRGGLESAIDESVRIDCWISLIARYFIVEVSLGIGPIPHRNDDVALSALRPRRLSRRQFAFRN